jgi:hypothetical protein
MRERERHGQTDERERHAWRNRERSHATVQAIFKNPRMPNNIKA